MPAGQEFENGKPHWIYIAYSCWCYSPDSVNILRGQIQKRAPNLPRDGSGPLVDVERVVDTFMSQNMIQPATSFLLDALKENKQEQGHLQTCLLKMNLICTPHKLRMPSSATRCSPITTTWITNLCEKAGLLQRVGICTLCHMQVFIIYKSSLGTQVLGHP